jgi:hypothetical protein
MILRQILEKEIHGYWDGGPKSVFDWVIDRFKSRGPSMAVVGSWEANHWFTVKMGKTEKDTLANAKRALSYRAKKAGIGCTFEYLEDDAR